MSIDPADLEVCLRVLAEADALPADDPGAVAIRRATALVGRENVIASTDCGLGGRVHPQIAWAKLEALSQGAALATKKLWRRRQK